MVVHYSFVYSLEKDAWLSVNEEAKEEEEEESTGSARIMHTATSMRKSMILIDSAHAAKEITQNFNEQGLHAKDYDETCPNVHCQLVQELYPFHQRGHSHD